jgi:hypothetical protein
LCGLAVAKNQSWLETALKGFAHGRSPENLGDTELRLLFLPQRMVAVAAMSPSTARALVSGPITWTGTRVSSAKREKERRRQSQSIHVTASASR